MSTTRTFRKQRRTSVWRQVRPRMKVGIRKTATSSSSPTSDLQQRQHRRQQQQRRTLPKAQGTHWKEVRRKACCGRRVQDGGVLSHAPLGRKSGAARTAAKEVPTTTALPPVTRQRGGWQSNKLGALPVRTCRYCAKVGRLETSLTGGAGGERLHRGEVARALVTVGVGKSHKPVRTAAKVWSEWRLGAAGRSAHCECR